ncbi:MAG: hypothetical protein E7342_05640, partial [Clostridiales bacterium]|nr:hypothetical protein [Clostridiales bacterium]
MKKKVIAIIVAVLLVLAAVVTIVSCVPTKDKTQENTVAVGDNGNMTENKTYAMPRAMSFSQTGLERSAAGSVSVNVYAVVYPENAPNKKVDWTVEWADTTNTSNVNDYITVVPESDGSANAVITCYKAFSGEIIISVITREGRFADSCVVSFIGKPSSLTIVGDNLNGDSGSFGSYIKIGIGNPCELRAMPSNVFEQVGADCNFTYSIKGYGSIVTKDNTVNTTTDAVTWIDGTEETVNLDDITTVAPWYSSMFDIEMSGNTIIIKANCTPENYITSQTRVSSSKMENDNKFFRYTDDNWYYELTITETISGVSDTIKFRPVQTVTGVSLS